LFSEVVVAYASCIYDRVGGKHILKRFL